ncbi:hypothetical protein GCM10009827_083890 [Dactylosporangium maewongense]|uniref:Uncharacterized protein n=1 Tax=Dactylosporangium maewongense TaxID=634393 RepID=A0ABN2C0Q2_9ACTN
MSPSKNLYIADADLSIWEAAERTAKNARTSVSKVVVDALRKHLEDPFRVMVNGTIGASVKFDVDTRPVLDYGDHGRFGRGWLLYYLAPGTTTNQVELRFIGSGDAAKPPVDAAQAWLNSIGGNANGAAIQVEIGDPAVTIEFDGAWLVEPDCDETRTAEEGYDAGAYWGVARTGRGRFAVYTAHCNERWPARLDDFDTLDEAARVTPADIIARVASAMGDSRPIRRDI